jgi:hypothetical protein
MFIIIIIALPRLYLDMPLRSRLILVCCFQVPWSPEYLLLTVWRRLQANKAHFRQW